MLRVPAQGVPVKLHRRCPGAVFRHVRSRRLRVVFSSVGCAFCTVDNKTQLCNIYALDKFSCRKVANKMQNKPSLCLLILPCQNGIAVRGGMLVRASLTE